MILDLDKVRTTCLNVSSITILCVYNTSNWVLSCYFHAFSWVILKNVFGTKDLV